MQASEVKRTLHINHLFDEDTMKRPFSSVHKTYKNAQMLNQSLKSKNHSILMEDNKPSIPEFMASRHS